MNRKSIILIIVIAVLVVGYVAYEEYNFLKMQDYLKTSSQHQKVADDYIKQADAFSKNNDYANAISMLKKGKDEISKAQDNDNNALPYANGVYKNYTDNDILLLQAISQLIDFDIYIYQVKSNTLNPGQEYVQPDIIVRYIDKSKSVISDYMNKEQEIISANPDKFKFLNQ